MKRTTPVAGPASSLLNPIGLPELGATRKLRKPASGGLTVATAQHAEAEQG